MDPAEVRRQQPGGAVHRAARATGGALYDSGDYPAALEKVLAAAGYAALRAEQAQPGAQRGDVRQLGIGLSVYVEITGGGAESGGRTRTPRSRSTPTARRRSYRHVPARAGPLDGLGDAGQRASSASRWRRSPSSGATPTWSRRAAAPAARAACSRAAPRCGRPRASWSRWPGSGPRSSSRPTPADLRRRRRPGGLQVRRRARRGGRRFGRAGRAGAAVRAQRVHRTRGRRTRSARTSRSSRSTPRPARPSCVRLVARRRRRHDHQPAAGRGAAARRHRPGRGPGAARGGRLRRRRQPADRHASPTTRSCPPPSCPASSWSTWRRRRSYNPLGAKGIGEAGTIGATPAVQNAVVDAVAHLGVRHIDMPTHPDAGVAGDQTAQRGGSRCRSRSPSTASAGADEVEPRLLLVHYLREVCGLGRRTSAATPPPAAPARCCVDGSR